MGQARDEAGNIWETDEHGAPLRMLQPASPPQSMTVAPNPMRIKQQQDEQARLAQAADLQNRKFGLDTQQAQLNMILKQMEIDKARKEADAANPINNPSIRADIRLDAKEKLGDIRTIQQNADGFGAVGSLLTGLMQNIPGTAARTVSANIDTVSKAGALTKILEMTRATGKNPFTPMSNSDVDLIAKTQGNLDPKLSKPEFNRQLNKFEGAYRRAYLGAGGKVKDLYPAEKLNSQRAQGEAALRKKIQERLPTIPPHKREQFVARAWQLFNEQMPPKSSGKPKARASSGWGAVKVSD